MSKGRECKKVSKLLEQFLDGELSAQEEELVKSELASCAKCRREFERLTKLRALIREVYKSEVERTNLAEILPEVQKKLSKKPAGLSERLWIWLDRYRLRLVSPLAPIGIAATLVMAVLAATLIFVSNQTPKTASKKGVVVSAEPKVTATRPEPGITDGKPMKEATLVVGADRPRRGPYKEKPYRRNECQITYYEVRSGTVIVEVDPDGDAPVVVWHFLEEGESSGGEDNRI